ncbi:MAG TPA: hypothetical protein VHW66_08485 [Stellaceae bacterium]|nr:hypothetical protein [Stellaceae bacterium]
MAPENDFVLPTTGDRFDRAVAVVWAISEIALDVFAMFFWSALLLFAAWAAG